MTEAEKENLNKTAKELRDLGLLNENETVINTDQLITEKKMLSNAEYKNLLSELEVIYHQNFYRGPKPVSDIKVDHMITCLADDLYLTPFMFDCLKHHLGGYNHETFTNLFEQRVVGREKKLPEAHQVADPLSRFIVLISAIGISFFSGGLFMAFIMMITGRLQ